jgi:transcriptional regulator with XRE-family HTH domain
LAIDRKTRRTQFDPMEQPIEWFRRMLAERRVTQAAIARATGIDETAISKMLNGRRKMDAGELGLLQAFFDERPPAGFREDAPGFKTAPSPTAPIFRAVATAGGDWLIARASPPINMKERPPGTAAIAELYGFHAPDRRAWPRFKTGEIVWVDPTHPAGEGDDVLILTKIPKRAELKAMLGEFVSATSSKIEFIDYSTRESRETPSTGVTRSFILPRFGR